MVIGGANGQLTRALREATAPADMAITFAGRPELDLLDSGSIRRAFDAARPNFVVNAAAYTAVDKAQSEPDAAFAINDAAVSEIAHSCAQLGAPLIHVSTDYVFSGDKATAYVETDPTGPINVYGQSKLAGERKIANALPEHLILRTSWVYAPYGQNFLRTMLRLGRERKEINVVQDQLGCPTYAPSLARVIYSLASAWRAQGQSGIFPWGTYHAAGQGETNWYEFAKTIFDVAHRTGYPGVTVHPISTSQYPTPAKRPGNSRLDCGKLKGAFGFSMPHWLDDLSTAAPAAITQTTS
jgi:dTDP-4-dehydrorhamnose reductase